MGCEFAAVVRRHGAAAAKPRGQLAARLDQVFELLFAVGGAQLGRWFSRADDRTGGHGLLERRPALPMQPRAMRNTVGPAVPM